MIRWLLSLLLAFSVVLYDQVPLFALMCRTVPQAAESFLASTAVATDDAVPEDGDRPVPGQPVPRVFGEPIEECDSDDLKHEPHVVSKVGFFRAEFRSDSYHSVSFGMVYRISTHLRI